MAPPHTDFNPPKGPRGWVPPPPRRRHQKQHRIQKTRAPTPAELEEQALLRLAQTQAAWKKEQAEMNARDLELAKERLLGKMETEEQKEAARKAEEDQAFESLMKELEEDEKKEAEAK